MVNQFSLCSNLYSRATTSCTARPRKNSTICTSFIGHLRCFCSCLSCTYMCSNMSYLFFFEKKIQPQCKEKILLKGKHKA
ncbi:hypothetical protein CICLE_v10010076mg [Citrus x clementina]|uniref:Uncharacterized protein n=1 Tax=Citrus clementina TaxID=85681 RepID=V4UJY9_CITCL|nr:hypothetical protein CICLE_v10010076mg [Citrus x clementina]